MNKYYILQNEEKNSCVSLYPCVFNNRNEGGKKELRS